MNIIICKKIFSIFFIIIFYFHSQVHSKSKESYKFDASISNYFLGIMSIQKNNSKQALNFLNKVKAKTHNKYHIKMIQTLVELEKFSNAISYLKNLEADKANFDEANLLLGLDAFKNKNFMDAKTYFAKLNISSENNFLSKNFLGNILISWTEAMDQNQEKAFAYIEKVAESFSKLKFIQKTFISCYFDSAEITSFYEKIINENNLNFSRYNFFLVNYLLKKNKISEVQDLMKKRHEAFNSNLLLKHSRVLFYKKNYKKLKNYFNCKNPNHSISEFFYLIANLHSSEGNYVLSNFYLKMSYFMNNNFRPNRALMAENYFYLKNYDYAKKIYSFLRKEGEIYSWFSNKKLAHIKSITGDQQEAILFLEKEYKKLKDHDFNIFYDLANFYKGMNLHEKSIKYYSLALEALPVNHSLKPKLLYKRGSSYERLGLWNEFEKDLELSLKLSPEQPYVLNYLAYSWLDKKINLHKSLQMLKKANYLQENDPYIIDSLGWAYYLLKNFSEAEKLLKTVVQLMPADPIVNDHYADVLWQLNKNLQARYLWNQILNFDEIEDDLKKKINHKLIHGITEKL